MSGPSNSQGGRKKQAVCDVLKDGLHMLSEKNMFGNWLERTGTGSTDLYGSYTVGVIMLEEGDFEVEEGFADANGMMVVYCTLDPELKLECPFSNVGINLVTGDN